MIAVEGDDDVAAGVQETALVGAPVSTHFLADDVGAERPRHLGCAIRGAVVHDDDLVDEARHALQHTFDPFLFVEAGDDDRYFPTLVQVAIVVRLFSVPARLSLSMMNTMKVGLFVSCVLLAAAAFPASEAGLSAVKNIYILPMGSGFDQYLANQLTTQGVFQVVTDPEKADAVMTDQIGAKFERQMEELYPPPPPPEVKKPENPEAKDEAAKKEPEPEEAQLEKPPISTFSRGKGNIFIVQRESRALIWSLYHRPKDTTPDQLNEAAGKVVAEIRTAMGLP